MSDENKDIQPVNEQALPAQTESVSTATETPGVAGDLFAGEATTNTPATNQDQANTTPVTDQQNQEERERAPDVHIGDVVAFMTVNGAERYALVTDMPVDGDVTLHVFLNFADMDYQEFGPVGLYQAVPYSSKNTPNSWHK